MRNPFGKRESELLNASDVVVGATAAVLAVVTGPALGVFAAELHATANNATVATQNFCLIMCHNILGPVVSRTPSPTKMDSISQSLANVEIRVGRSAWPIELPNQPTSAASNGIASA